MGTSTANRTCGPPGSVGIVERVDVEVGEVAVADRDQVAECTEVGLQVGDRFAVAGDGDGQFRLGAGDQLPAERHVEPVDAGLGTTALGAASGGSRRGR